MDVAGEDLYDLRGRFSERWNGAEGWRRNVMELRDVQREFMYEGSSAGRMNRCGRRPANVFGDWRFGWVGLADLRIPLPPPRSPCQ